MKIIILIKIYEKFYPNTCKNKNNMLYLSSNRYAELAERSKAAVLKTVEVMSFLGFESLTLRHYVPNRTHVFSWVIFLRRNYAIYK